MGDPLGQVRQQTLRVAMLEQLRRPPPVFAAVAAAHFRLKRDAVLRQVRAAAGPGFGVECVMAGVGAGGGSAPPRALVSVCVCLYVCVGGGGSGGGGVGGACVRARTQCCGKSGDGPAACVLACVCARTGG